MDLLGFEDIVEMLSKYQGLTKKSTQRLVQDLVINEKKFTDFQNIINNIRNLTICPICHYFETNNICKFCDINSIRDGHTICVVASQLDVLTIEKANNYNGVYHILNGEININKNTNPDDLNIQQLIDRVKSGDEVILALNSTFAGKVTAKYIHELLKSKKISTTIIAEGIPLGASIDYMDEYTINNAIKNRKKYED